ncbi:MAG: homocysteine S-methyltransferase family protein, partial [Hyphomicrobiaceae bacterium]
MTRYEAVMQRIRDGERILIDGATGTEVERRGVPQLDNAWNGGGALSHPDIVREVHEDYIRHGAEIVISNTFATHRHALRDAGADKDFEAYNRRAVELAIEARARMGKPDVLVAGGMSYWSWTGDHPPPDALREGAELQAGYMADAGADLLMLEMMVDIDKMLVVLEAAQSSRLPVWAGMTCKPMDDGTICLRNGDPLVDALAALDGRDVPLVSIMHSEVRHIDACLDVLQAHWSG